MKKSLLLGALLSASPAWAGGLSGDPGGLSGGGGGGAATSITAGTTATNCTALQLFYNDASSKFNCMAGTSWDNTNRSLTITGATVTANNPVLNLTQTWNNAAVAFKGILLNVTTTASSASSTLLDIQNNGISRLSVNHNTGVVAGGIFSASAQFVLPTAGLVNWTDAFLGRSATASLRLGNSDAASPVAQTLGVQNVIAGTTNTAGANWTLRGSLSTGSGASGDIILQTGGTGAGATAQNTATTALTVKGATQAVVAANSVQTTCTTVTGLGAAGTAGRNWCVTDQLTACPALGGTFTGGGAVVCKAFDDGTNWTHQ